MTIFSNRRALLAIAGAFVAIALVTGGIWFAVGRGGGSSGAGSPATSPSASPQTPTSPVPTSMTVTVYFHKGNGADPRQVVATTRTVAYSPMIATATLNQLLAGPTAAERSAGYWSFFSSATAGMLRSVRIANGVARVDFSDFSRIIPNASTSTGSATLLAELDTTLKQFSTVRTTVYSFNGDVAAFYLWLQLAPPVGVRPGQADAVVVAYDFLTHVVGMSKMVDEKFRWTGADDGEVDFHPPAGEDGKPLTGVVTTVSVHRTAASWSVTGVRTSTIQVDVPTRLQTISSPVTVSGKALAYEGNVHVRVLQTAGDKVTKLGEGNVTGGGDIARPFSGQISFPAPNGGTGWVVFSEESALNGDLMRAAAIQVAFAATPAPPQVVQVQTSPALAVKDGWVTLPDTAGTVTFTVRATGAEQVRLFLTPTGTGTATLGTLLGQATRNGDDFSLVWKYLDEPVLAHLTVVATGAGGQVEQIPFNVYHN